MRVGRPPLASYRSTCQPSLAIMHAVRQPTRPAPTTAIRPRSSAIPTESNSESEVECACEGGGGFETQEFSAKLGLQRLRRVRRDTEGTEQLGR